MVMLPKPEPRSKQKARAKREQAKARRACWIVVYEREHGRCQHCGKSLKHVEDPSATEFTVGIVHEVIHRSQGGSPTDPNNCQLCCRRCSDEQHGLRHGRGEHDRH